MMNCQENLEKLNDYTDALIDDADRRVIEAHLSSCEPCRTTYEKEQSLREALRQLAIESPSSDFRERVFAKTYAHHARAKRFRYGMGLGGAIAASFFLVLTSNLFFKPTQNIQQFDIPGMTISLNEVHNVKLIFKSAQNLSKATFTIVLPPGLELDGYPDQSKISWEGQLQQGENLLVLPVIARNTGTGELTAYVTHNNKEKSFRLQMNINHHQESSLPHLAIQSV